MSTCQTEDLGALLEQVRCGDEMALTQLLQRYESQLRLAARVLLSQRLRTQLDSLDLVQSVHRVLLPGLRDGKYDVSSLDKLLALARTVVRHKCIRHWRRIECQHTTEARKAANDAQKQGRHVAADDPSQIVAAEDLKQQILAELSGLDRQLIELRAQGYGTVDIAERLQLDPHALRARLGRLRNRLRRQSFCEWL